MPGKGGEEGRESRRKKGRAGKREGELRIAALTSWALSARQTLFWTLMRINSGQLCCVLGTASIPTDQKGQLRLRKVAPLVAELRARVHNRWLD